MNSQKVLDPNHLWLHLLKRKVKVSIKGRDFELVDFQTSNTLEGAIESMEQDVHGVLGRSFSPGDRIFDIGANTGVFSLYAHIFHPQVDILAVEPMPHNFENLYHNTYGTSIRLRQHAISDKRATLCLHQDPRNSGSASVVNANDLFPKIMVEAISLDELFDRTETKRCAFLKLDVEGSEYGIIHQTKALKRCDYLSIEVHDNTTLSPQENAEKIEELCTKIYQSLKPEQVLVRGP